MPGENIHDWSVTAANNGTADSAINWAEGQARASVNDSARSMMAAHAKNRNLNNGSITTAGSANAQSFSSGLSYTSSNLPVGLRALLKCGFTNTGPATLNCDGVGNAQIIDNRTGLFLSGGELVAGRYREFLWDGTNWILLARAIAQLDVQALAGAYSVLGSDGGKVFSCSGTFTLSHTVLAAQGEGFSYWIKNTGDGTVTIDPAGSETIDGAATLKCLAKQEFQVVSDGANWITIGRQNVVRLSNTLISTPTVNSSFVLPPDYVSFEILVSALTMDGASSQLRLLFANDGVPTWIMSSNYFSSHFIGVPPASASFGVSGASANAAISYPAFANAPSDAWVRVIPALNPAWQYKTAAFFDATAARAIIEGGGILYGLPGARPTHVLLQSSVGNMTGGNLTLIGAAP